MPFSKEVKGVRLLYIYIILILLPYGIIHVKHYKTSYCNAQGIATNERVTIGSLVEIPLGGDTTWWRYHGWRYHWWRYHFLMYILYPLLGTTGTPPRLN